MLMLRCYWARLFQSSAIMYLAMDEKICSILSHLLLNGESTAYPKKRFTSLIFQVIFCLTTNSEVFKYSTAVTSTEASLSPIGVSEFFKSILAVTESDWLAGILRPLRHCGQMTKMIFLCPQIVRLLSSLFTDVNNCCCGESGRRALTLSHPVLNHHPSSLFTADLITVSHVH